MRARMHFFVAAVLAVAVVSIAPPATAASGTAYSFNLVGPNTAENPTSGDTIRVTGAGTFDTGGAVNASGVFTHFLSNGAVFARGTWKATAFSSFTSFGGPSNGQQGGLLSITVTLFPAGGTPVTGVPMTVTCLLGSPPAGTEEGTTVGGFTEQTGGFTLIHLQAA